MTARWEWVDRTQNTLNLPDSKTDKKTVILTPPALSVLDGIDRLEDNPFIIVGKRPGQHLVNPTKPWKRICARADLHDIRLHDLRHSCAIQPDVQCKQRLLVSCLQYIINFVFGPAYQSQLLAVIA